MTRTKTDVRIRELARTSLTASQHRDCAMALGRREMVRIVDGKLALVRVTDRERRAARRRCCSLIASLAATER